MDYDLLPANNGSPCVERAIVDYEKLDWSQPDISLARSTGLARERIRQVRAKLGKPKTHFAQRKFLDFKKRFCGLEFLRYQEVAPQINISPQTFAIYCGRLGISRIRRSRPSQYPWDEMNWEIPNNLLSQVWQIKTKNLVAAHRCNHTRPHSRFRIQTGKKQSPIPDELKLMIELEKSKFEKWSVTQATDNHTPPLE